MCIHWKLPARSNFEAFNHSLPEGKREERMREGEERGGGRKEGIEEGGERKEEEGRSRLSIKFSIDLQYSSRLLHT